MDASKNARLIGHKGLRWSAVALALSCSACTTVSQTARMKPSDNGAVHALYIEESKPATGNSLWTKATRKERSSEIQQLNHAAPEAGVTRIRNDSAIQQTAFAIEGVPTIGASNVNDVAPQELEMPLARGQNQNGLSAAAVVAPAQWIPHGSRIMDGCPPAVTNPCPPNTCPPQAIETCPPDPRWPAPGPNPLAMGMTACDACNVPSPEKFTDEYLCDGGDRELPVHYDSIFRRGLDTEDTILEFTDRDGNERMKPTNKVCIYAPRFASVRTVSRPHEESMTNEAFGVGHTVATNAIHTRLKASNSVKREMTGRIAVRSRASGLETDAGQGIVSSLKIPSIHDKLLNIYQSMTFVQSGQVDDADTARLNYGLQMALAWTREQNPVITAKTDSVLEGHFEQATAVITCIDEKETAEKLRIVKLTDKKTAVSGDEIEFTIRYDNLGGREVYHIRIVDNLTPRLEYVDDSATSDRAGRLVLQDNGEGSQILIWELEDPLPGKTGGVVTFKARVR